MNGFRASCTGIFLATTACQTVVTPVPPDPVDIAQQHSLLSASPLVNNPVVYRDIGYDLVDGNCRAFFDGITKAHDRANFARKELTLGGAAAAGILQAVSAGVVPITITGIAVPLVADSIDNYQNFILVTPYPDETYTLIKSALKTYQEKASNPIDIYTAHSLVQGYAAICTYSGIHQLAKQALTKAKTKDASPTTTTETAAPAFIAPSGPSAIGTRVHIPNVIVE
jgi:hypothetical protein